MAMSNRQKNLNLPKSNLERSFSVERASIDEEARTIELAFSSEEPYERWFGIEVLDHTAQSVKLDRLMNGAALLVDHDRKDHVGVVETARIDTDRRGRAVVRFSKSARGEEVFRDVLDGIRTLVSVAYRIIKYQVTEQKGGPDLVRVTEWEPYEISIVSVPADPTVGVGRSDDQPKTPPIEVKKMTDQVEVKKEVQEVDATAMRSKIRTDETNRIDAIRTLADKHEVAELGRQAITEGWEVSKFTNEALNIVGQRNNEARSKQTEVADVDLSRKEHSRFSFVRLMDALTDPNNRAAQQRAAFELDVCSSAADKMPSGFKARGVYLPPSILDAKRDLSAGTATDGAELVGTNLLAGSYIEVLRANMTAMRAGARLLPGLVGNVDIPRQTSGATATWISAEDGDATESEPQFDQVQLTPKDLAAYTEVTRRLMQQSTPAIEALVRNDLYMAIALGLDSAVFYGSGGSGQPQGLNGATGVDDPTISSALAPTYAEMVKIIQTIMASKALTSNASWIISPATWEKMMTTPKQGSGIEGNFIMTDGRIVGYNHQVSQQLVTSDFVFGDFSQILVGEWGGIELNVDPYTHSLKGKTRFVIFKTCDIAIRHPEAFSFHDAA